MQILFNLTALRGRHEGEVYVLAVGQNTIGRDVSNDVCLHDPSVSSRHAILTIEAGEAFLHEVQSRNGIVVNGERVTETSLKSGDRILLGSSLLEYRATLSPSMELRGGQNTIELSLDSVELKALVAWPEAYSVNRIGAGGAETVCRLAYLLTSAESSRDLLTDAVRLIGEHLDSHYTFIALIENHDGAPRTVASHGLDDSRASELIDHSKLLGVLERREPILLSSELETPSAKADVNDHSTIYAPLSSGGVLGLIRTRSSAFTELDLRFAALSAHLTGLAYNALAREETAIQRSQDLEEAIQNHFRIVGCHTKMLEVYELVGRVSASDLPVLIRGETGTGKELVANAVHVQSLRASKPFVTVNCAALPTSLLESTLFGHTKGAFTGATDDRRGCFEQATGGSLFLDEIAELSAEAQAKLLRVVETGELQRVGDEDILTVDVRIICATHRDLPQEVQEKRFREDLYYRLNVVEIILPPLRERRSDIPLLAEYFLERGLTKSQRIVSGFTNEATDFMRKYPWPGNIRELRNAVDRALVLGKAEYLSLNDLGLSPPRHTAISTTDAQKSLKEIEREHIEYVLDAVGWKKIDAARVLGIDRKTLSTKCKEYELFKEGSA